MKSITLMKYLLTVVFFGLCVSGFCPRIFNLGKNALVLQERVDRDREWVEKDMKDAGKADHESDRWVTEDMERLGSQGGDDDSTSDKMRWIAKDMKQTGQARTHQPQKKRTAPGSNEDPKEEKNWNIAKDMKRTGKNTDWIARDMEEAGHADSHSKFATEHWLNKLDHDLNRDKEALNKVKEDMEKTGRLGSDSTVQKDMEQTGRAQNPYEVLQGFLDGVSYKLSEWTRKAFDESQIVKDMSQAGKSTDQSWLAHEMESAGREGSERSSKILEQSKELKDNLTSRDHEANIARDMKREGRADAFYTRKEHKRNNIIYEDMKLAGGAGGPSEERVRQDMENAGHANSAYSYKANDVASTNQYRRELEAFKKTKHAKPKAPVKPAKKQGYDPWSKNLVNNIGPLKGENSSLEHEKKGEKGVPPRNKKSFAKQILKKIIHPRKPWNEL